MAHPLLVLPLLSSLPLHPLSGSRTEPSQSLTPSSSMLKLSKDGNLVLLNASKFGRTPTNTNVTSKTTIAVLLDSGYLVLRDGSNTSRVLWQSIDHPANTWLPGGKVGLNMLTGENQQNKLPGENKLIFGWCANSQ